MDDKFKGDEPARERRQGMASPLQVHMLQANKNLEMLGQYPRPCQTQNTGVQKQWKYSFGSARKSDIPRHNTDYEGLGGY